MLASLASWALGAASGTLSAQTNGATTVTDPWPHRLAMVAVNGVRVPYLDWGGSGPALVFLAGPANSAHIFDDFAPRRVDRCRVLAVTRTGFRESDQPERDGYDFAGVKAPILSLYSESTTADAFPWLAQESPEYARADKAQIAAYPDETERRMRALLTSLALR